MTELDETISYNPEQYLVCEQGVIVTEGLYLAFLVSPDVNTFQASCPSPTPEPTQTHVHRVGDVIQPSHPLSSPSPHAFYLSQHQVLFQ